MFSIIQYALIFEYHASKVGHKPITNILFWHLRSKSFFKKILQPGRSCKTHKINRVTRHHTCLKNWVRSRNGSNIRTLLYRFVCPNFMQFLFFLGLSNYLEVTSNTKIYHRKSKHTKGFIYIYLNVISGILYSTKTLQSTLFQNPRRVSLAGQIQEQRFFLLI